MIKENQLIKMKWSSRCAYLKQLGYEYTGRGMEFYVKAEDICKTSHKKVILVCDKCGKEFQGGLREHYERDHDYCSKCKTILTKQTCLERYGVDNPSKVEDFKEKRTNTILDRFGVENAFQSEEIKEKIKQHYLDKYGVEYNSQVKQTKRKREETCLQKYGVKYLFSDFKKKNGYKRSIELSEIYNLYRQDFCGCVYSEMEMKRRTKNESSVIATR